MVEPSGSWASDSLKFIQIVLFAAPADADPLRQRYARNADLVEYAGQHFRQVSDVLQAPIETAFPFRTTAASPASGPSS